MMTPTSQHDIVSATETLIAQKQRAFARMGVSDIFARRGYYDFFREIAAHPLSRQLVHVSRLDVGAIPAALNLGLVFRGSYYHVLASYDDGALARFGPGAAHLHELMRYAIEQNCSVFDFTVGDEPYKRDWCDTELKLYDHVSAVNARGMLVAKMLTTGRSAKRAIKQSAWLWPAVTKLRATLGSLTRRVARR
jgi:CelD/BcsL family acetyltransferase involved in cellulose biosynthesis